MSYRILHVSDTHCMFGQLEVPDDIDMIIHSGDFSNKHDPYRNEKEVYDFLEQFADINIKNRILVAGNHDTSIEKGLVTKASIETFGITYLHNESVEIDGFKIWGSPFSPSFGSWAFMKARNKIHMIWDLIPDDTDILVTHGPPKGILDLTYNYQNKPEPCGCSALRKRVFTIKPKLAAFGHIHNHPKGINNAGTLKLSNLDTIFSNGSCATDGKMGQLSSHGNIIELERK